MQNLRTILLAWMLLIVPPTLTSSNCYAQSQDQKDSLFGLEFGMTLEEAKKQHPSLEDFGDVYLVSYKVGDIPLDVGIMMSEGRIEEIMGRFEPKNFDRLLDAIREKFGPGLESRSIVQNGLGVQFEQVVVVWELATGAMRIEKYSSSLDRGMVVKMSKSRREKAIRELEDKQKAVLKGL